MVFIKAEVGPPLAGDPYYETGYEALVVMLRGNKYSPLTLREASKRFVRSDPNHIHKIVKLTKLDPERTIKSLTDFFELNPNRSP